MHKILILVLGTFCLILSSEVNAQLFKLKKKESKESVKEKTHSKEKVKPYNQVITKDALSQAGLFNVHKVKDKNYFEIPNDLLEKEILVVSRISGFVKNLNFGGAGTKSRPQQVIRWQKKDDQIILRSVSYNSVASHEDPIYKSVKNNNFEPVIMIFDIEAYNKDKSASVINVNPLFTTDVEMIGAVSPRQRKKFGIKNLDAKRCFIENIVAYPKNVEVKHVLSYRGDTKLPDNQRTGTLSVEMNQSFIALPTNPMQPRLYDARVGYFSISQTDYSLDEQKAASKRLITRWRLEPKDPEAYARGEAVDPIKPIIYYIDPSTPDKWRPYIKQGVNDWQKAFELAGFKNAIMAKDAPDNNPNWSPEDVRYSTIRYISTDIQNAQGPHVHDPRTGEILESDIMWYHNVMNLLRNWYFVQTAAINPEARTVKFKEEIMGRLIRFVAVHEVGHTLGLPHNMGASVAYRVDSLRSVNFTQRMGTSPSIMDYARFNYIAQPEDGAVGLMPDIGIYDKWAIDFGYRIFPGLDENEERTIINQRIKEKAGNHLYRYGRQRRSAPDHTAQTEDLGDDSMLASEYGIKNLKRILPNLIEWTYEEGKQYENLSELYSNIFNQYRRYMGHVIANIGGVQEIFTTFDEDKVTYRHSSKVKQKRAIQFLDAHLFQTPKWLIDKEILRRIESDGLLDRIQGLQSRNLNILFHSDRMNRLIENEALNGPNAYSITNLFNDTYRLIFSELNKNTQTDTYRRNLHRAYISKMQNLIDSEESDIDLTDVKLLARATLKNIQKKCTSKSNGNTMSHMHFADIHDRIQKILDID